MWLHYNMCLHFVTCRYPLTCGCTVITCVYTCNIAGAGRVRRRAALDGGVCSAGGRRRVRGGPAGPGGAVQRRHLPLSARAARAGSRRHRRCRGARPQSVWRVHTVEHTWVQCTCVMHDGISHWLPPSRSFVLFDVRACACAHACMCHARRVAPCAAGFTYASQDVQMQRGGQERAVSTASTLTLRCQRRHHRRMTMTLRKIMNGAARTISTLQHKK